MAERLDATFFAFRKRENGGVLLGASIVYFIALIVLFAVFGGIVFVTLGGMEFFTWYSDVMSAVSSGATPPDPPSTINPAGMLMILPLEFIFLFVFFVVIAAYESACVRWMLNGEKSGPLNLHFGADMWRVYGTYWVWLLYSIVGMIGFFVVSAISGMVAVNLGDMGWIVALVIGLGYFFAWFYTTIRLSPMAATSIGVGQFAPFKAWRVTSGRFWALFGAYFLLFILYIIAFIVLGTVFFSAFYAQILSGLDLSQMQTDPTGFAESYNRASMAAIQNTFSTPAGIAMYVGGQVVFYAVALFFYVLWFGVESRAVQAALEEGKIEKAAAS